MDSKEINLPSSIDTYLLEQQTLTAVERFSDLHDQGLKSPKGRSYRALIPGNPPQPGQQYAFEVDLDKCSGCKSCVTGCHTRNGLDPGEVWRSVGLIHGLGRQLSPVRPMNPAELSSSVKNPGSLETACRTKHSHSEETQSIQPIPSPGRLQGFVRESQELKLYFQQNITSACHHCDDPACLTGCPVKAYDKNPVTGVVKHLDDQCIGCKYCIYRCPYGVPQYNEKKGIVRKCDMCTDRLETGEAPACIQSCPNEAISITLISVKELKENPAKHFNVPSLPDPFYTRPSTRYKTARKIPESALAADHVILAPQPPEIPLVLMLVFTQLSVGAVSLLAILQAVSNPVMPELFFKVQSLIALSLGCLGMGFATLHLGRPLYAFRSFLGFTTSWLSREVVFFTFYINLLLITVLHSWLPIQNIQAFPIFIQIKWGWPLVSTLTATLGFLGVYSSSMIYKATPRPWWNSIHTISKFFLTGGLLGSALTLSVASLPALTGSPSAVHLKLLPWIFLIVSGLKLAVEMEIFSHLKDAQDHPLRKTALLIKDTFRNSALLRLTSLILGCFCLLFPFSKTEFSGIFSWAGLALLMIGECLERHLFFRAVVPPKMAGQSISE